MALDRVEPRLVLRLKAASRAGGVVLVLLGGAVLLGWWLHVSALVRVSSAYAPMKPNTALCFVALGLTLALQQARSERALGFAKACAWLVLVLAGLTLLEYALGQSIGIDALLAEHDFGGPGSNRMTAGATIHFCLLALSLLLIDARLERSQRRPSEGLAIAVGMSSCVVLLGYFMASSRCMRSARSARWRYTPRLASRSRRAASCALSPRTGSCA